MSQMAAKAMPTAAPEIVTCRARRRDGQRCRGEPLASGFCLTHDPAIDPRRRDGQENGQWRWFCRWAGANWEQLTALGKWLAFASAWHGRTGARTAKEVGVSPSTFHRWLTIEIYVRSDLRRTLAAHFRVNEEWILRLIPAHIRQQWTRRGKRNTGRSRHKQLDKISRWSRQRLHEEITRRFADGIPKRIVEKMNRLSLRDAVGKDGYRIYFEALGLAARKSYQPSGVHQVTERGKARRALWSTLRSLLKGTAYIFRCQGCAQLVYRISSELRERGRTTIARGKYCADCWGGYLKHSGVQAWIGTGCEGPPPTLHQARGRHITPDRLRDTLVLVLRFRLDGGSDLQLIDDDYDAIYNMERRLQESKDRRCQMIVWRLEVLGLFDSTPFSR